MYRESENYRTNKNEKEDKSTRMDRGKLQGPRDTSGLIEHLINNIERPISERANSGSSGSDLMSVWEKEKVLVHINSMYMKW